MEYGVLADLVRFVLEGMGTPEARADRIAGGFTDYLAAGGFVMPPLILAAVLLWFAIGYRVAALRMGTNRDVQELLERYAKEPPERTRGIVDDAAVRGLELARQGHPHLRRWLDDEFMAYDAELKKFSRLTVSLVEVAPIMGLLGTVVGMIETFDSLQEMALFTQSGGIAGGISQALFTTQMGLVVAIPGLIVHGLLRKRQQTIAMELARIKDLLCTDPTGFLLPRAEVAPAHTGRQRQADG